MLRAESFVFCTFYALHFRVPASYRRISYVPAFLYLNLISTMDTGNRIISYRGQYAP